MTLLLNPILTRELRARWRGGRSMILVFGYVSLLAIAAGIVYASASISNDASAVSRDLARVGHDLFITLSTLQIIAWMLIGPALTATSIAAEREHGLLELLQLTPLSSWRICGGKLGSAFLLVVLLMFAPLPVTALCFLLGGVSPGEFCIALAVQIATVTAGMCLGLWASSRSRRATSAMTSTFVIVIGWALFTVLIMIAHESRSPWTYVAPGATNAELWRAAPLDFVWRTNPLFAFLIDIAGSSSAMYPSWLSVYAGIDVADWVLNVVFQFFAALLLWIFAARTLSKPFADAAEDAVKVRKKRRASNTENATSGDFEYSMSSAPSSANSSVLQRPLLQRPLLVNPQSDGLWWQWNWLARFRSPNPMLEREVRRRARWRRPARRSLAATRVVAVGVALVISWGFWRWLVNPYGRSEDTWMVMTWIAFLAMLSFSAVQGALAFTREHEAETWQGIQLSLLSPRQILWGKVLPPFGTALLIGAILWAPTVLCIENIVWGIDRFVWPVEAASVVKVSPAKFVSTLLIAASASWVLLCWGVFWSVQFKRVWPAVVWTVGSILLAYLALPLLLFIAVDSTQNYNRPLS